MVAAEPAARETAERGSTEVSRRLDGCDAAVLDVACRRQVDGARQLTSLLGLRAGCDGAGTTHDWAVRAIVDGLGGHNSTLWAPARRRAGPDRRGAAGRAGRSGSGRSSSARARPARRPPGWHWSTPLQQHLAEGGKLRGTFKSGVQRDAEPVLEHATVDGLPVTTPEHVDAGRTRRWRRRPAWRRSAAAGRWSAPPCPDRPTSRCSSRWPGSSTCTRGWTWCSGSSPRSRAIRTRAGHHPVVAAADQPGRVAGVRRRARRGAAAGRGGRRPRPR